MSELPFVLLLQMTGKSVKYSAAVLPLMGAPLDKPTTKEGEELDHEIMQKVKAMDVAAAASSVTAPPAD